MINAVPITGTSAYNPGKGVPSLKIKTGKIRSVKPMTESVWFVLSEKY